MTPLTIDSDSLPSPVGFSVAIQCALYDKLKADAALTALIVDVYDDVPQADDSGNALKFPFVTIGEDSIVRWDSMTEFGCEASVTIHVWSRQSGRFETKVIQNAIYNALHHQELPISDYHVVDVRMEDEETFLDQDGETRHGVQTFRVVLDQLEI